MYKIFGLIASAYGLIAVILGALGAHALNPKLNDYQHMIFEKGVRYQLFHVATLFVIFLLSKDFPSKTLKLSGWFTTLGVLFFSGSLYLLATQHLFSASGLPIPIWIVTPLGGFCFIFGWVLLFVSILKIK